MKNLLAAFLTATLLLVQTGPATASEGGDGGRETNRVIAAANRVALVLTMNPILFNPTQIILLAQGGAFGMFPPDDLERIEEPSGGGLFGKIFKANRKKAFEELERRNFVTKVGRAYRIGDMVFVDSMFFDTNLEAEATTAGRLALENILNGNTFVLGPARNPFNAMMANQILAFLFFMRATEGKRLIYRLDPTMGEAEGIEGVKAGVALNQPIAFLAFFTAIASGKAQPIGDVWQIGDKVVVAAPLEELFPPE